MSSEKVCRQTAEYAINHGSLYLYRESLRKNRECARAIEKSIREGFDGMHMSANVADQVIAEYGAERVCYVLANTLQIKEWDGRFSRENKRWAESFEVTGSREQGGEHRDSFVVQSHPAVLDGFVTMVRKQVVL